MLYGSSVPDPAAIEMGRQRRLAILVFLRQHWKDNGYSPSVREIGAATGVTSPNAVHTHLRRLEDEGYITITPGIARSIALTRKGKRSS
jgi:repressor LexA